jgi:hypothetical protein
MIDRKHDLSITRQAKVLRISRGGGYYLPRPVSEARDHAASRPAAWSSHSRERGCCEVFCRPMGVRSAVGT